MVITKGEGDWRQVDESIWGLNGDGDLTWGAEHTTQYTDDVLYSCTLEAYIILLTNVTPINSIKMFIFKLEYSKIDFVFVQFNKC